MAVFYHCCDISIDPNEVVDVEACIMHMDSAVSAILYHCSNAEKPLGYGYIDLKSSVLHMKGAIKTVLQNIGDLDIDKRYMCYNLIGLKKAMMNVLYHFSDLDLVKIDNDAMDNYLLTMKEEFRDLLDCCREFRIERRR